MSSFRRKPLMPKGYREWPAQSAPMPESEIQRMYDRGFAGAIYDEAAREELIALVDEPDGERVAYDNGLVGTSQGRLSIPFIYAYQHYPKCWPCPGQTVGDCVSHAGKNCGLVLIGVESVLGQPDEVTGIVEGFPEVSAEAEAQGVVACENIYGDRGHTGHGASCERLIKHVCKDGGIMLRQNYPELGLDLTRYDASIGTKWGRSGTPENVRAEGRKHQIRTATAVPNWEAALDYVANGYPVWACSGLGWSNKRDENGYSRQSGSWSHSWLIMGADRRKEVVDKYGFPLGLYNHDWGRWNSGGRRIFGTDADIPEGSMWIDARLLDKCDLWAMSSMNGFKRRELPDWKMGW